MKTDEKEIARFPAGWYRLAPANKIKKGNITTLNYFETSFVCYRNEKNEICVFNAYCPHMGAHLGVGGKIVNDTLICPFHGWKYNSSGDCVEIPYCQRIPKRAKLQGYPIKEIQSYIYLYFDTTFENNHANEKPLAILVENDFKVIRHVHISFQAVQKIINVAKKHFNFIDYGPGFLFATTNDVIYMISRIPIKNGLYHISFAISQSKKFKFLHFLNSKMTAKKLFQQFINEVQFA